MQILYENTSKIIDNVINPVFLHIPFDPGPYKKDTSRSPAFDPTPRSSPRGILPPPGSDPRFRILSPSDPVSDPRRVGRLGVLGPRVPVWAHVPDLRYVLLCFSFSLLCFTMFIIHCNLV